MLANSEQGCIERLVLGKVLHDVLRHGCGTKSIGEPKSIVKGEGALS